MVDDPTVKVVNLSRKKPAKPDLDHMGPGVESVPADKSSSGPRSTMGRGGMRGGFKRRGR